MYFKELLNKLKCSSISYILVIACCIFTLTRSIETRNPSQSLSNSTPIFSTKNETLQEDTLKKKLEFFRNMVYLYYLPVIVLVGIMGNTLTIILLLKEKCLLNVYDPVKTLKENLRKSFESIDQKYTSIMPPKSANMQRSSVNSSAVQFSSSNYFIASLAISDLVYNIILALVWLTRIGLNVLNIRYICQISIALSYICSFLSAAFTTIFTFQRFMAVVYPLKSATSISLQSKAKIKSLILILVIFSVLMYSFSLFMYDAEPKKEHEQAAEMKNVCGIKQGYVSLVNIIDNTLDSFLTLIMPSVCILCMNCAIIKALSNQQTNLKTFNSKPKILKSFPSEKNKGHKETTFHDKSTKKQTNSAKLSIISMNLELHSDTMESDKDISTKYVITELRSSENQKHSAASNSHITKTLLAVSFFFILLNSPFRATKLISYIQMLTKHTDVYSNFDFVINEVLINLYFTSYSVNFFLYSLCGKKFRISLKALTFSFIVNFYKGILSICKKKR